MSWKYLTLKEAAEAEHKKVLSPQQLELWDDTGREDIVTFSNRIGGILDGCKYYGTHKVVDERPDEEQIRGKRDYKRYL